MSFKYIYGALNVNHIQFDENQLHNLHDIAMQLFADKGDPRSYGYQRVLVRPQINWLLVALHCLIPPAAAAALCVLLQSLGVAIWPALCVTGLVFFGYVLLNLKRAIICLVRIYQRYAPDAIRKKCRFEPSCSQYMILSLEKYGLWKGLFRGIGRLRRCNIDHGGFEMP